MPFVRNMCTTQKDWLSLKGVECYKKPVKVILFY